MTRRTARRRTTSIIAALAAAPLFLALAGCATGASDAGSGDGDTADKSDKTVKIGVVGKSDPQWPAFVDAAAEEGITVELVDFGSYELPNPALSEGEIDLNQFQHIIYLAQYNEASGDDLTPIGSTQTYPLGLYSTKYDDVKDIKEGETVIVPDDASNQARGLLVLQSAGLIELDGGGSPFSDLSDIDEAKSKVKVEALEAAITPEALPDVAAAIINNDFVEKGGLSFDDALFTDDPKDPSAAPYVNIFASRAEDVDNETYLKLVEIFQTDEKVQEGLKEASGGTGVTVQIPAADLAKTLAKVQKDVAASK
ncbi:MetQ/NlpA family ABC transporter substrate-binding protein [Streptomyces sp. AC495_CC817]|uniref:MetQ/NlpA family ABC transporter substrate-binding protein n=1 Tax=Streptomyces sp. AC495_CC817 TaxID=2823900 RepID=UPI001C256E66|nr:MetQ/NlpA family ABC transporter substrate-binding protein [Streptomyces sp. AC495_CC817]